MKLPRTKDNYLEIKLNNRNQVDDNFVRVSISSFKSTKTLPWQLQSFFFAKEKECMYVVINMYRNWKVQLEILNKTERKTKHLFPLHICSLFCRLSLSGEYNHGLAFFSRSIEIF